MGMEVNEDGVGDRLAALAARSSRIMAATRMEKQGVKMGKCTGCGEPYPSEQLRTPGHWKSKGRVCPKCFRRMNENKVEGRRR